MRRKSTILFSAESRIEFDVDASFARPERTGLPSRLTAMMSSLTRVTPHTEVMADDDVRKFDAKRTVLARGLPLATSTAKVRALPSSSHPGRSSRARSLNSLGRSADF